MLLPKTLFTVVIAAALLLVAPTASEGLGTSGGQAEAKTNKRVSSNARRSTPRRSAAKRRSGKGNRGQKKFSGHGVGTTTLRDAPLEKPSGELWIGSENLKEELRVSLYDDNGDFNEEALAKLDHVFRCRRTQEQRSVDPRLFEMLSRIQDHFEGKQVTLVSGFRFQRNEGSRHYHASAMDIRIAGVPNGKIRAYAESLDMGGMESMGVGIYPTSGFVHVDFRAPGQPSYRWTDRSGPGSGKGKGRSRRAVRRTPNT